MNRLRRVTDEQVRRLMEELGKEGNVERARSTYGNVVHVSPRPTLG
jgi:hypothetical protein